MKLYIEIWNNNGVFRLGVSEDFRFSTPYFVDFSYIHNVIEKFNYVVLIEIKL